MLEISCHGSLCETQVKLVMTFMKHYDPKPLLVKKDGTLFIHKGHLVFVAFSYTTHYPPSAELIYLALHPMESISLNSFVLLEHLAILLTSTLAKDC